MRVPGFETLLVKRRNLYRLLTSSARHRKVVVDASKRVQSEELTSNGALMRVGSKPFSYADRLAGLWWRV